MTLEEYGDNPEGNRQSESQNEQGRDGIEGRGRNGSKRAISAADSLRARLPAFEGLVQRAEEVIRQASGHGRIAVSFSGGKDSTVLLDLVRRAAPGCASVWFDSGAELQSTRDLMPHYDIDIMLPQMSITEICRYCGHWGYAHPQDSNARFDLAEVLIYEPSRQYMALENCTVAAIGLRAQESKGRATSANVHGELFLHSEGYWRLCPLLRWKVDDIWAYIASRGLRYNGAYDKMSALGVPRAEQRIGTSLGGSAISLGRYAALKRCEPELFNELAAEFPLLRAYV